MNVFDDPGHTDDFFISTDRKLLDNRWLIANLLSQPWTECWTHERMAQAIANSLAFGIYHRMPAIDHAPAAPKMVGFARVITDECTYSLVCDVVIDPDFRFKGLGKFVMATIISHHAVKGTVSLLRTSNAAKLYEQFDYHEVKAMRRIPNESAAS